MNLAKFYNELKGMHYTVDDFHSYSFWKVWGGTAEEVDSDICLNDRLPKS